MVDRFVSTMQRGVSRGLAARNPFLDAAKGLASNRQHFPSLSELASGQRIEKRKLASKERKEERKRLQEEDRRRRAAKGQDVDEDEEGIAPVTTESVERETTTGRMKQGLFGNNVDPETGDVRGLFGRHANFGTLESHFWRPDKPLADGWGMDSNAGSFSNLGGNQIGNASRANVSRIRGTDKHDNLINRVSRETGVPREIIKSIMAIESGGDVRANSHAGAVGLMQIMPNYWQSLANQFGGNLWDPYTNVRTGTQILKDAYQQYGSWDAAVNFYFTGNPNPNPSTSDGISTANQYLRMFHDNLAYLGFYGAAGNAGGQASGRAKTIIGEAEKYLGWQYNYGGASPSTSFDCSGLTQWAFRKGGIELPRTAHAQWVSSQKISNNQAQAGDLVFFERTYNNPRGERITHVGIYLGNGKMLHAGSAGVEIADLNNQYYRSRLVGFGRY